MLFLARNARRRHGFDAQYLIELGIKQQLTLAHELPDGAARGDRRLRDLRRCRVSDVGTESRRQRGAAIQQLAAPVLVSPDAGNAAILQHAHRIGEDARRVNGVPGDHRHHHVQFELPAVRGGQHGGVAADDLIADLVQACPELWLLVTSREALAIDGERIYVVPPLMTPELDTPAPMATLSTNDAVRLFAERAAAARCRPAQRASRPGD